ncbi:hypothetical protein [Puniceicoccus vermicola]|uniref:Uncharacterized protein n=1 Tax=Puniceicoccus vermicola TaxID=388746 RepID=A0A7X1B1C2_9BACT|nr:hypothetical protein [Puniceicoccus vermicola]MBC2603821.1 hypothetical protein [Puniceicoccus vermicola]
MKIISRTYRVLQFFGYRWAVSRWTVSRLSLGGGREPLRFLWKHLPCSQGEESVSRWTVSRLSVSRLSVGGGREPLRFLWKHLPCMQGEESVVGG